MSNEPSNAIRSKVVRYTGLGGAEVIEVVDREVRAPGAGEVRLTVTAAAVNPTDLLLRDPSFPPNQSQPRVFADPVVPGMDAAGIVESVGPGVTRLCVGDRVMAAVLPRRPEGGAYGQHIVVPAASVVAIPEGVSVAEASTLPMNGLTALLAFELAGLTKGQTLAVSGGAGLLAHYAIALAKQDGLRVIADAKPSEVALVKSYGADVVVERGDGFAEVVRREIPGGVDALLDTAVLGEKTFGAIRDGGIFIPVRGWSGPAADRGIEIKPVFVHQALERTEWLERLRTLVTGEKIKLRVTGEYTPEQTFAAQSSLEAGGLRGRPVIRF